jgi:hypothetical protein
MTPWIVVLLAFIALASTSMAQTANAPIAIFGGTQRNARMIALSNMAGDMEDCDRQRTPYVGTIVKRQFDEDEVTIIGIVIREPNDTRAFINLDIEQLDRLPLSDRAHLSSFLGMRKRVKVWTYSCGAAGRVLYAYRIKALN